MNKLCVLVAAAAIAPGCGSMLVGAPASSGASEPEKDMRASLQDDSITAEVKSELRRDAELRSLPIWVETHNRVVVLTGTVDSWQARDRAHRLVSRVPNVEAVENRLEVGTRSGAF
ncbi:hypothetical protein BH24PSE2_BH24PSE2_16690 [soil metagenome]